jgi:hypothetical protein
MRGRFAGLITAAGRTCFPSDLEVPLYTEAGLKQAAVAGQNGEAFSCSFQPS